MAGNAFGSPVAITNDALLVGARGGSNTPGTAWLYQRAGDSGWSAPISLTAEDTNEGDWFGTAVALSDSHLVVGATGAYGPTFQFAGAAYVELYQ